MTTREGRAIALTDDGALVLTGPDAALALCMPWLPIGRREVSAGAARAVLEVQLALPDEAVVAERAATFTLGGVAVTVDGDVARLSGGASGGVSLGGARADLRLPASEDETSALFRRSALTAAAALLLGRIGRALAHAGAVVHPTSGRAWLLVGDTHAGKSTTVANLARAGWGVLADDTVSLGVDATGAVTVEGWPRTMHLDAGWGSAAPAGHRVARDPREVLAGAPRAAPAALGGLLFPNVDAERPTRATARSGADALALLIRQSPWLFADALAAPSVLALLRAAASAPAAALSLGTDSFGDPARLDAAVRAATG